MNYYCSEIFLVKKKAHPEFRAEFRNSVFYSRPLPLYQDHLYHPYHMVLADLHPLHSGSAAPRWFSSFFTFATIPEVSSREFLRAV